MTTETVLTTNDVRIQTATITIQVVRIGKKQMTQSVFRQLPQEFIWSFPPDMWWGVVRYCPSNCSFTDGILHIHVIAERDGKLFRCPIYEPGSWKRAKRRFPRLADFDIRMEDYWEFAKTLPQLFIAV